MYCVKCGVKLQDSAGSCPLCGTPVYNPDGPVNAPDASAPSGYSSLYPLENSNERIPLAILITIVFVSVSLVCMVYCFATYGLLSWSGYVMLGLATIYVIAILPMWFSKPNAVIFVPLGFIAVCGYLLYICLYNGGNWFLSFVFPVLMLLMLLSTAGVVLLKYIKRGRLFIIGGLLLAIGGTSMLVEMFEHITFGTRMFAWSLYSVGAFTASGAFFILAGIFRPLREWLKRRSFM